MDQIVLFVDDDPNLLHCMARQLRNQPYQIYTARSATEALQILKTQEVDVVVLDEEMPGLRGSDVAAWVAQHRSDVRRIILTGRATVESAMRAINDGGVYRYLCKPCDVVELACDIRRAIEDRLRERRVAFDGTLDDFAGDPERKSLTFPLDVLLWRGTSDEPEAFRDLLIAEDLVVERVDNEADALHSLRKDAPDALLWEVAEHDNDAPAVCRRLSRIASKTRTALVLCFQAADDSLIATCLESGARDCLFPQMGAAQMRSRLLLAVASNRSTETVSTTAEA